MTNQNHCKHPRIVASSIKSMDIVANNTIEYSNWICEICGFTAKSRTAGLSNNSEHVKVSEQLFRKTVEKFDKLKKEEKDSKLLRETLGKW